eukprot:TRINITY_DN24142_c0_g2_i1.p1 TRINITY_DN24142_c0_g2~~TRINITY_DN24142_c0_g2_i1.p1  ORF type:complete len:515 (+),score=70.36 TRINITY_DN24142_c0_g2_i1:115-1659(+)
MSTGICIVDVPPWQQDKFDVKKKPPPVPRPRWVTTQPPDRQCGETSNSSSTDRCTSEVFSTSRENDSKHADVAEEILPRPPEPTCKRHDDFYSKAARVCGLALEETSSLPISAEEPQKSPQRPKQWTPSADYTAQWTKWNALPTSLRRRVEGFQHPTPPVPPKPPTKDALDFLESLLQGTDSSQPPPPPFGAKVPETTQGAAQVARAAEKLRAQAEEARARRERQEGKRIARADFNGREEGSVAGSTSTPARSDLAATSVQGVGVGGSGQQRKPYEPEGSQATNSNGINCKDSMDAVKPEKAERCHNGAPGLTKATACKNSRVSRGREGTEEATSCADDVDRRIAEQQEAHRQRLIAIQRQADDEQRRLREEMCKEQDDMQARRKEQDERKLRMQREVESRRLRAERAAEYQSRRQFYLPRAQDADRRDRPPYVPLRPSAPPPPANMCAQAASGERKSVLDQLAGSRSEPLEHRKHAWRQMCLQWHPDKCGDKDGATEMFQFLQGLKHWFLEPP